MTVKIELDNASGQPAVPQPLQFQQWVDAALTGIEQHEQPCSLSIRLVDENESTSLNSQYRGKQGPTNILSFPADFAFALPAELPTPLGDLAICVPVLEREAGEQQKTTEAHWAHLTVHGVLHLKGFDHENDADAEAMEALEIRILHALGYNNPYEQR